jgi:hypothetical protein
VKNWGQGEGEGEEEAEAEAEEDRRVVKMTLEDWRLPRAHQHSRLPVTMRAIVTVIVIVLVIVKSLPWKGEGNLESEKRKCQDRSEKTQNILCNG